MLYKMSDKFEKILEEILDKRGKLVCMDPKILKLDEAWYTYNLTNKYLKFYENEETRAIVVQDIFGDEVYIIKNNYDIVMNIVGIKRDKSYLKNLTQVQRARYDNTLMSIEFKNILKAFDRAGIFIIVKDLKDKYSDIRKIVCWRFLRQYVSNIQFYEHIKKKKYAVVVDKCVYHLGLGYVGNQEFCIAVKKDKRSLRCFTKVQEDKGV